MQCGAARLTFSQLDHRSNQLARALIKRGLERDACLAVICRNSNQLVETMTAARKAGLRATIINPMSGQLDMEAALRQCNPDAVVTNMPATVDVLKDASRISVKIFIGEARGFENYEAVMASESCASIPEMPPGIPMPLTSGTTGVPKVIYRKHNYVPPYLRQILAATAFDGLTDVAMVPCGLQGSGVYNLGVSLPLQAGVGVIISDISLTFDLQAEEVLRTIQEERVTHLYLPNFIMRRFLALPAQTRASYDLRSLKCVLHGGSQFPIALKSALIDWLGPIITEFYAGAEGGGTVITSTEWQSHRGSVGKPASGLVKIFTPDFADVASGSTGHIYFHSPRHQRFEYLNDQVATQNVYHGDYFTLGDLGHLNDEGYLYLAGRSSEVIDFSGYNVLPAEIDAVLLDHPAVRACAAIGLPDGIMGETVGAVIVLREGHNPGPSLTEELLSWCGERLAMSKCPRSLVYCDDIPGFLQGKVNRKALRALFPAAGNSVAS